MVTACCFLFAHCRHTDALFSPLLFYSQWRWPIRKQCGQIYFSYPSLHMPAHAWRVWENGMSEVMPGMPVHGKVSGMRWETGVECDLSQMISPLQNGSSWLERFQMNPSWNVIGHGKHAWNGGAATNYGSIFRAWGIHNEASTCIINISVFHPWTSSSSQTIPPFWGDE